MQKDNNIPKKCRGVINEGIDADELKRLERIAMISSNEYLHLLKKHETCTNMSSSPAPRPDAINPSIKLQLDLAEKTAIDKAGMTLRHDSDLEF